VSAALGPHLKSIPDGETGERLDWITWLEPVFARHREATRLEAWPQGAALDPSRRAQDALLRVRAGEGCERRYC
jgi:hypothetical protein